MKNQSSRTSLLFRGTVVTVLLRLLSFVGSQWTLRRVVDPAVWGRTNIQLELVLTTVLFISREGFRLALTRGNAVSTNNAADKPDGGTTTAATSAGMAAWLSLPIVTLVAGTALTWHLLWNSSNDQHDGDYRMGGILYCLAAWIEGWGEPAVLHALTNLQVATKAAAEGGATLVKTAATVALLQRAAGIPPVTAFGAAQVLYALTYTIILYMYTWRTLMWPSSLRNLWHGPTVWMIAVFTAQGLFKHLLTEGDRLVLTTLCTYEQQGVYAMAAAYGGLAARLLLQPLEENARLWWSRLVSDDQRSTTPCQSTMLHTMADSYTVLVKIVVYLGLVLACLAVHYTALGLHILAGPTWATHPEAAGVLSAFCIYTAVAAVNGLTEAFVYATARQASDMVTLGVIHTIVAIVLYSMATVLVPWYGTKGLVAANAVAMALRTMYSLSVARRYFQNADNHSNDGVSLSFGRILSNIIPPLGVWVSFGVSWVLTRSSLIQWQTTIEDLNPVEKGLPWYQAAATHVGIGIACGMGTLSVAFVVETSFRRKLTSLYKGTKND
jgi:oligosaccharide translocation protein RFT1